MDDSRSNQDDQVRRDEDFKDLVEVAENIDKVNEIVQEELSEQEKKEIMEGVQDQSEDK